MTFAAVVLAGGGGSRLGGAVKPLLTVEGSALLTRVLAAVVGAEPVIVVGPERLRPALPAGTVLTSEEPPGSGPVAGLTAGLTLVPPHVDTVVVLAADLPFLTPGTIRRIRAAAAEADVAVLLDGGDRRQYLIACWRVDALRAALSRTPSARVRDLFAGVRVAEVVAPRTPSSGPPDGVEDGDPGRAELPAWFDCDTPEELERARNLLAGGQNPSASSSASTADR